MTTTVNQEYLNYRIEQAFETLNAAKVLINNRFWNSSVTDSIMPVFMP